MPKQELLYPRLNARCVRVRRASGAGALRSAQERPRSARSAQERPRNPRSAQERRERPECPRSAPEQSGAPKSAYGSPRSAYAAPRSIQEAELRWTALLINLAKTEMGGRNSHPSMFWAQRHHHINEKVVNVIPAAPSLMQTCNLSCTAAWSFSPRSSLRTRLPAARRHVLKAEGAPQGGTS